LWGFKSRTGVGRQKKNDSNVLEGLCLGAGGHTLCSKGCEKGGDQPKRESLFYTTLTEEPNR